MRDRHFVAICRELVENPTATQRELAANCGLSLGLINGTIKECLAVGYLLQNERRQLILTGEGLARLETFRVKNAIILAAGFGSRCVPLTYETPKGLLEVYGEPMIERQIKQLIEKDITDIIIVVGYKKEKFDYLIDKYGVRLIYNPEYATKNNLASLYRVLGELSRSYILVSDLWMKKNIFHTYEAHSWYGCRRFAGPTDEWCVTVSKTEKMETLTVGGHDAWGILGPVYFSPDFSETLKGYMDEYYNRPGTGDFYWEHILKDHLSELPIYMNRQDSNVYEFENLEELRAFDPSYSTATNSKIMQTIAKAYGISEGEVEDILPVKLGMTNRSFTFRYGGVRYIMRIPGEDTGPVIDREQEYNVYKALPDRKSVV